MRSPAEVSIADMSIERATMADAGGILDCLRAAFEPYRPQYTADAYRDTVLTPDTVPERITTMIVLVARVPSESIVGTIAGHARGTEGHLRGMAVRPEWHGKGVSARLLDAIERELAALGCTEVTLDTTAPLRRAVSFYSKHEYVETGRVSNFFGMPLFEYRKRIAG